MISLTSCIWASLVSAVVPGTVNSQRSELEVRLIIPTLGFSGMSLDGHAREDKTGHIHRNGEEGPLFVLFLGVSKV